LKHLVLTVTGYQMQYQKISATIQQTAEAMRTHSTGYSLPLWLFQRRVGFRIQITRFPRANFPLVDAS
jgi:hypothetical protein